MCAILLPINPKYSQDILKGVKTFELRRSVPKRKVDKIYIYETSPTMRIVGEFTVKHIHSKNKQEIWELTKGKNSVSELEFENYFKGKEQAHAYEIKKYTKYKKTKSLKDLGFSYTPQGFVYADHL